MKPEQQESLLQFFAYAHLPEHLMKISMPFSGLANLIVTIVPRNPERTVALRKLLEAKDCAVRAMIFKDSNVPAPAVKELLYQVQEYNGYKVGDQVRTLCGPCADKIAVIKSIEFNSVANSGWFTVEKRFADGSIQELLFAEEEIQKL